MNVLSALRQEDEDLYDICLHYPDTYSPQEIRSNLEKQGYKVLDPVGDGGLVETMEYLLDTDIDYDDYGDCDTNEEMIMRIAEDNDVCVEIHTNSFENQIEKYNSECESGEVIRLYKEEEDDEEGNQVYCPVVKKCGKIRGNGLIKGLDRKDRIKIDVHTNPDVKVLWKLVGDFTKEICSCVLECEIDEYDPMELAIGIVDRAKERERNGIELLPKQITNKQKRNTPELEQHYKDITKLDKWKQALKGSKNSKCSNEVRDYLDLNLPNWRTGLDEKAIIHAKNIVERAIVRFNNGENLLPRQIYNKKNRLTIELEQEYRDSTKLSGWKLALKGQGKRQLCYNEVRDYLDKYLKGWRDEKNFDEKALKAAKEIVLRQNQRPNLLPRQISKEHRNTSELEQEAKDGAKISNWKNALKGQGQSKCCDEVRDYLDINLPDWRTETDFDEKAIKDAKEIVSRKDQRPNLLPRNISKEKRNTLDLEQENKDATKIRHWKNALKGQGNSKCCHEVRDYLDINLPDWRTETDFDEKAIKDAKEIVLRKNQRPNLLPRHISKENRNTPELEQEAKDAKKIGHWKNALKGQGSSKCCNEVRDYLDINLPNWRTETDFDEKAMDHAKNIVERANDRFKKGEKLLPRRFKKENITTPELEQENKDGIKLGGWKMGLNGVGGNKCCDEVRIYLDTHLKGWADENDEIWKEKLQELKAFIIENKRKPSSKNENEKQLLKWLYHQTENYKKKSRSMNYPEIYTQWTKFLEEYKKYFNNIPDLKVEPEEETMFITLKPKAKKSMKLKEPTTKEPKETQEQRKQRTESELSTLHQRYKTLTSQNLQKEFQETPELWHKYHAISEENEKSFPEESIPRNRIIQELTEIKGKRTRSVVDMGCGKAQIAEYFANDKRFTFINYDHVSSNENVLVQDISRTPLEDDSVDMCILCLAMWGSNCRDYIKEAYRILESGGKLYIMEATKRWSEQDEYGNIVLYKKGDKMKVLLEESGFKIVEQSIEKFCMFICIKI